MENLNTDKKSFTRKKTIKIIGLTVMAAVVLCVGGFFLYASDYYRAEPVALAVMKSDIGIETVERFTLLSPLGGSDTALIFYPGAKVEASAYLPILEKLKHNGITCVLVEMPFNFAFFDANAANRVYELLPNIQHWYIGGHSLGGAMASGYASKNQDKVEGLILLGAYLYGDYPPQKALTVYGTFNSNLEKNIHYTDNIVRIEGGNHAQFGNYGKQKGDPDATIDSDTQQSLAVEAITAFVQQE